MSVYQTKKGVLQEIIGPLKTDNDKKRAYHGRIKETAI